MVKYILSNILTPASLFLKQIGTIAELSTNSCDCYEIWLTYNNSHRVERVYFAMQEKFPLPLWPASIDICKSFINPAPHLMKQTENLTERPKFDFVCKWLLMPKYMQCFYIDSFNSQVRGYHFLWNGGGSQIYWGHKFFGKKNRGVIKFLMTKYDDQNLGSQKMTTDSVYFVQKDWLQYNHSLFRGKVYRWWGVINIFNFPLPLLFFFS